MPTSRPTSTNPSDLTSRILLGVAALASVVPLFCARHLPMSDLPEHIATMATLRHWSDVDWANRVYFQIAGVGETPY